jgi:hypothetical protein
VVHFSHSKILKIVFIMKDRSLSSGSEIANGMVSILDEYI